MWKTITMFLHKHMHLIRGDSVANISKPFSFCVWSAICPLFFPSSPSSSLHLPALWFRLFFHGHLSRRAILALWVSLNDWSGHFVDERYRAISNKRCERLNATEGQLWTTQEVAEAEAADILSPRITKELEEIMLVLLMMSGVKNVLLFLLFAITRIRCTLLFLTKRRLIPLSCLYGKYDATASS